MVGEIEFFRKGLVLIGLCLCAQLGYGQMEKEILREGNKLYQEGKFEEAQFKYTEAELLDRTTKAGFNKANAQFRGEQVDDAIATYESLGAKNDLEKARIQHNIGNGYMQKGELDKAVDAYKEALRANPKSNESRYNLMVAMKQQQQEQEQQQEQQDQNQDQKKENQDKQENKEQQEQQQEEEKKEEKKEEEQKEEEQQQQEQDQPKPNEQQAEQMLKAMEEQEKKAQEKMQKAKMKGVKVKIEKDW